MNTSIKLLIALLGMLFLASAARADGWNAAKSQQIVRLAWSAYCPPQSVYNWDCFWCKFSGTPKLSIINTIVDGPTKYVRFVRLFKLFQSDISRISFEAPNELR